MFESFRNLEDVLAMAKHESLKSANNNNNEISNHQKRSACSGLEQSFADLDFALEQAQKISLQDSKKANLKTTGEEDTDYHHNNNNNGSNICIDAWRQEFQSRKQAMYQSFQDLDEATALAIQNSLNEQDRGLFESFRNLDGAMDQAAKNSMNGVGGSCSPSAAAASGKKMNPRALAESFTNLEDALQLAQQMSLKENRQASGEGKGKDFDQFLETLDEDCDSSGDDSIDYDNWRKSFKESLRSSFVESGSSMNHSEEGGGDWMRDSTVSKSSARSGSSSNSREKLLPTRSASDMCQEKERTRRRYSETKNDFHASNSRVEFVSEPAPNLSRLARRHADRRFNEDRAAVVGSFNNGKPANGSEGVGERRRSSSARMIENMDISDRLEEDRSQRRRASSARSIQDMDRSDRLEDSSTSLLTGMSSGLDASDRANGENEGEPRDRRRGALRRESGRRLSKKKEKKDKDKKDKKKRLGRSKSDMTRSRSSVSESGGDEAEEDRIVDLHYKGGRRSLDGGDALGMVKKEKKDKKKRATISESEMVGGGVSEEDRIADLHYRGGRRSVAGGDALGVAMTIEEEEEKRRKRKEKKKADLKKMFGRKRRDTIDA